MHRIRSSAFTALLVCLFSFLQSALAQGFKAEILEAAPPRELSTAIAETLSNRAIRISSPQGPLCEIWLTRRVLIRANPAQQLGVIYPQLSEGTLIGVVRFIREAEDYRRQTVRPGVYTMRYALHPVDGNHLGVSPQRDFLLLVPADSDTDSAPMPVAQLYEASDLASGTTHPSIWSLVPPEVSQDLELPAVAHRPDEELWLVSFRVEAQAEGQSATGMVLSLVIAGHAPEA